MLGKLLCDSPSRVHDHGALLITQRLRPEEISATPDERLFVIATFAAARFAMLPPTGTEDTRVLQMYGQVLLEYRAWDPEGMPLLTMQGKDRAWDQINDIVLN